TVIDIYTSDAARAAGLGQSIGSIEVGKSADLIVLDQMIFDVPPDQLADTRVEMTFFEGRRVYERGE
ncbi:amidohydrolase family protein, partial [Acinetobacter baumannii]